jgi:16S rRNA (uracil1498-N3)-methyltransferase
MRIHRFYLPEQLEEELTVTDERLLHQWRTVLRVPEGGSLRLFNGRGVERIYAVTAYEKRDALLRFREDAESKTPSGNVTLFFSLLKKDKNEWVIQKCTEIGISRFVPIISERTEKTGFSLERIGKIAIEAAEQCGRADIPELLEPMPIDGAIAEFGPSMELYVCDEGGGTENIGSLDAVGCFVGPEGGWTDGEKKKFSDSGIRTLSLGKFTLRAETAAIVASAVLNRP